METDGSQSSLAVWTSQASYSQMVRLDDQVLPEAKFSLISNLDAETAADCEANGLVGCVHTYWLIDRLQFLQQMIDWEI